MSSLFAGWLLLLWGVFLACCLALFALQQQPALLARYATAWLSESLEGATLSASRLDVAIFPTPALRLHELCIRTNNGLSVLVEACDLAPDWGELLQGRPTLKALKLIKPAILIEPQSAQDVSSAVPDAIPNSPSAQQERLTQTLKDALRHISQVRLEVEAGTILIRDPNLPVTQSPRFTLSGIYGSLTAPETVPPYAGLGELTLNLNRLVLNGKALAPQYDSTAQEQTPQAHNPLTLTAQFSLAPQEGRLHLQGTFVLKGDVVWHDTVIPLTATLPYRTIFPSEQPGLIITNGLLESEQDRTTFTGTLHFTEETPQLTGTLDITRFSLPRWFAFARALPSGIENALASISGQANITLTPQSLDLSKLRLQAGNMTFSGNGGIPLFSKPKLTLSLHTPLAKLNTLFPELLGKTAPTMRYARPPLVAIQTPNRTTQDPASDFLYDIKLNASRTQAWKTTAGTARVRIRPTSLSTGKTFPAKPSLPPSTPRIDLDLQQIYGGSVKGSLFAGNSLMLDGTLRNIASEKMFTTLAGKPVLGGVLNASATLQGHPSSPESFLNTLEGKLTARFNNGFFMEQGDHIRTRTPFDTLSCSFDGSASKAQAPKGTTPLTGLWTARLNKKAYTAQVSGTGTLYVDHRTVMPDTATDFPLRFTVTTHGLTARGNSNLSFSTPETRLDMTNIRGTLVPKWGQESTFSGELHASNMAKAPQWKGNVRLTTPHLRSLLASQGLEYKGIPQSSLRSLWMQTEFTFAKSRFQTKKLEGAFDETQFSGFITHTTDNPNLWDVTLHLDSLNLDNYLPDTGSAPAPRTAWSFDWMRDHEIQGSLSVETLTLARIPHRHLTFPIRLQQGILTADPIRAEVCEGTLGAGLKMEATQDGSLSRLRYTLNGINMLLLSKARNFEQALTGTGHVDMDLRGLLRRSGDIPAVLNGTWRFHVNRGSLRAATATQGGTAFRSLGANGRMDNGTLSTQDILLTGTNFSVKGYGKANLVTKQISAQLMASVSGLPNIPIHYYGSLDNPQRSISATGFLANTLGSVQSGLANILEHALSSPFRVLVPSKP